MGKNPAKDFGPIADDYAFFERHATESREDTRAYVEEAQRALPRDGAMRMLDFGCGTGGVTAQFLQQLQWPANRVELTLVEPVDAARESAVARLAPMIDAPIIAGATLPAAIDNAPSRPFNLILANHVFYYVPELRKQLASLLDILAEDGILLTAIAPRSNVLIEFWTAAFNRLGQDVPYHVAEDLDAALQELGATYRPRSVAYKLTFEDTNANRLRILRFLLADYLPRLPESFLLSLFDRYAQNGRIAIETASDHFIVSR